MQELLVTGRWQFAVRAKLQAAASGIRARFVCCDKRCMVVLSLCLSQRSPSVLLVSILCRFSFVHRCYGDITDVLQTSETDILAEWLLSLPPLSRTVNKSTGAPQYRKVRALSRRCYYCRHWQTNSCSSNDDHWHSLETNANIGCVV